MYVLEVTHDIESNTLEATWVEEVDGEIKRVRCHNYSPSQKAMFLAEVEGGDKWTTEAGWTDEYCAEYTAAEVAAANQQGAA